MRGDLIDKEEMANYFYVEYNLMITNNSSLDLKSVVVTVDEKDTIQIDALIDSNIKLGEVAKFQMKNGKHVFKVTLNPKKNYSVSREFTEIIVINNLVSSEQNTNINDIVINLSDFLEGMTGELLVKNPIDYLFNSTFDLTGIEDQIVALYAKKTPSFPIILQKG
ncbi:hypothetical protein NYE25_13260 [Paenibacillus sp. FSL E2-8871]|uniref:hypothetical protein n=1 Tax=Paenibacillus sp. FSL E2-8871 TaxID=2975326 RepID=UPI0030F60E05